MGGAGISSNKEEGESRKNARHVSEIARRRHRHTVDVVVGVIVVHQSINVLEDEVGEGAFGASGDPGVVVKPKNHQAE